MSYRFHLIRRSSFYNRSESIQENIVSKKRQKEAFTTFGDYSVNLFKHITYSGNPPARALFDMAAVAIVENPSWADTQEIPAPILKNNLWVERPDNLRKIKVWENFKRDQNINDFYQTMDNYELAGNK